MCLHDSGLRSIRAGLAILAVACFVSFVNAQPTPTSGGGNSSSGNGNSPSDPGPRGAPAAAGGPVAGLSNIATLYAAFNAGAATFQEVEDVPNSGLGPRFNSNSCVSCHAQPAVGGSSPASNPQVQFANSQNRLPYFIQSNGPVREARFVKNPDGTPDGGVHALFTIGGRPDQPSGCNLVQEDYSQSSNIIFRIPTPTFGLGLVEAIPDSTLAQNLASSGGASLGITGRLNRNGNDGTVTRFGWKAQNKSLLMFAGEAYNVEMGISNLLFNTERDETPNCSPVAPPNSIFNLGGRMDSAVFDDINAFANFMRFLAPPSRGPIDNTVTQGSNQFFNVGCGRCHTVTLQTGASPFSPLANQTIHPYSDFAIHHMGPGLADGVSQGLAGGDEFRTAPLWGLGQRLFFLHDGRTSDLIQAIREHSSPPAGPTATSVNSQYPPSEASAVVRNFFNLSSSDQQAVLNFLRSL
jgi:CxxC motif-containing protein (DUF1111 family)